MQEAIIRPLSLCAWLGIIADLWSYLLQEITKINEPCGTCWMPWEIYCSACAFLSLCCWCCQEFFYKCKWRYGLTVEEEKSSFNVIKHSGSLSPTSPNYAVSLHIRTLESSPHLASDLLGSVWRSPSTAQGAETKNTVHVRILSQSSRFSLDGE